MSSATPRILVAEGNPKERCEMLIAGGLSSGAEIYRDALKFLYPDAKIEIVYAADANGLLPAGAELAGYDGVVLGGSGLNIPGGEDDPRVQRQIQFARKVFEAKVPFLGSCWGLQVAAVAAGGVVATSRRGREVAFARKIGLSLEGRGSQFFEGKTDVFDSPAIHYDEVTHLPSGSTILAANSHCSIQAATINHAGGTFWGVQYHPEFNLHHVARLINCYVESLVKEGFYADIDAARQHAHLLQTLHQNSDREDLAWLLGLDQDVLDPRIRYQEIGNWVKRLVLPHMICWR